MARGRDMHNIMPYEVKGGKAYLVRVQMGPGEQRKKAFRDLATARRIRDEWLSERHGRSAGSPAQQSATAERPVKQMTVRKLLVDVYWKRHAQKLAPKTRTNYYNHVRRLIDPSELAAMPVAKVEAEDVLLWRDWCEDRGETQESIRTALKVLSPAFQLATERPRTYGIRTNPVAPVKWPTPERQHDPHVVDAEVVERVRVQILRDGRADEDRAQRDALMLSLMAQTGMRPSEAMTVQVMDIEKNDILIPQSKSKTKTPRRIPLWSPLAADIRERIKSKDLGPEAYLLSASAQSMTMSQWEHWRDDAYIPARNKVANHRKVKDPLLKDTTDHRGARAYDVCRHSYAAIAIDALWDVATLSEIMGHSVETLSRHYTKRLSTARKRGKPVDPEKRVLRAREKIAGEREKLAP